MQCLCLKGVQLLQEQCSVKPAGRWSCCMHSSYQSHNTTTQAFKSMTTQGSLLVTGSGSQPTSTPLKDTTNSNSGSRRIQTAMQVWCCQYYLVSTQGTKRITRKGIRPYS